MRLRVLYTVNKYPRTDGKIIIRLVGTQLRNEIETELLEQSLIAGVRRIFLFVF